MIKVPKTVSKGSSYRMKMIKTLVLLIPFILASQDEDSIIVNVILRDGSKYRGIILNHGDKLNFKTEHGDLSIPTRDILFIDYGLSDMFEDYYDMLIADYIYEIETLQSELKQTIEMYIRSSKDSMATEKSKKVSDKAKGHERERFIPYDDPPIPIGGYAAIQKNMKYPKQARQEGIQGTVVVQAYIDENGNVTDAVILRGIPELNEAAIQAVKKTKFKPAKQGGKSVGVWISIPINFRLSG